MIRPIPGPWQIPPPFTPRYVDTGAEVMWRAACDRCGCDAAWRKGKDATWPVCMCPCDAQEGAA